MWSMQQPPSMLLVEAKKRKNKKNTKKKTKEAPAVEFTEAEFDSFLSADAIDQELKKMGSKNILPSQVTADVVDAVRWQENKEKEIQKMKGEDTRNEHAWISDVAEDFITFGVSPSNTKDEVNVILKNLDATLEAQEDAGFGPEARNYIMCLRRELEVILEKL
jgi:hypothetical protein